MKKKKGVLIDIVCAIIIIALTILYFKTDDTVSTEPNAPIGYALIYHPDGDERVEFVEVRSWDSAKYKIIKEDGSYIVTQYATLYYYPKT